MCRPYILGRKSGLIHSSPRSEACRRSLGRKSRQSPAGGAVGFPNHPELAAVLASLSVFLIALYGQLLRP